MVEANHDTCKTYNTRKQIKFKTAVLKASLCVYSDSHILLRWTITISGVGADEVIQEADEKKKKDLIFKNCASFADCISEINNIQVNNLKDLPGVMPIYNLIEFSIDNYLKTSRNLWQYYKDFQKYDIRDSKSFEFKEKTQEPLLLLVARKTLN